MLLYVIKHSCIVNKFHIFLGEITTENDFFAWTKDVNKLAHQIDFVSQVPWVKVK